MSHKTTVFKDGDGQWTWVCSCGDGAPRARRDQVTAQYYANWHKVNKVNEEKSEQPG
jgi:hypothetical protein